MRNREIKKLIRNEYLNCNQNPNKKENFIVSLLFKNKLVFSLIIFLVLTNLCTFFVTRANKYRAYSNDCNKVLTDSQLRYISDNCDVFSTESFIKYEIDNNSVFYLYRGIKKVDDKKVNIYFYHILGNDYQVVFNGKKKLINDGEIGVLFSSDVEAEHEIIFYDGVNINQKIASLNIKFN